MSKEIGRNRDNTQPGARDASLVARPDSGIVVPDERPKVSFSKEVAVRRPVMPRSLGYGGPVEVSDRQRQTDVVVTPKKIHEEVRTQHTDVIASGEVAAEAVGVLAFPILHDDPKATVIVMDNTGQASQNFIEAARRRGFHTESGAVSPSAMVKTSTVEQTAYNVARAMAPDGVVNPEDRGIIRVIGKTLSTDDDHPTLEQIRDAAWQLLGRTPNTAGSVTRDQMEALRDVVTDEELDELRPTLRRLVNGADDLLAQEPAHLRDTQDGVAASVLKEPARVISMSVPETGLGDPGERQRLLETKITQMLAKGLDNSGLPPGTPSLLAVMAADRLEPAGLQRLLAASRDNGVSTIFTYEPAGSEPHMDFIGSEGTFGFSGISNGRHAAAISEVVGEVYGEELTGRSINNSHSTTTSNNENTTENTTTTKNKDHKGKFAGSSVSTNKTTTRTSDTSTSDSSSVDMSWTIGAKRIIRADQIVNMAPGEIAYVRPGAGGKEIIFRHLAMDGDTGHQFPLGHQLREALPDVDVSTQPLLQATSEIGSQPDITNPIARARYNNQLRQIEAVNRNRLLAIDQAHRDVTTKLLTTGLGWESFVTAAGDTRVPDLSQLNPGQHAAVTAFAQQPPEVRSATLAALSRRAGIPPEIASRVIHRDGINNVAFEVYRRNLDEHEQTTAKPSEAERSSIPNAGE